MGNLVKVADLDWAGGVEIREIDEKNNYWWGGAWVCLYPPKTVATIDGWRWISKKN